MSRNLVPDTRNEARKATLVVVTGPIASGKTSVAFELAALARQQGLRAEAIDLDTIIEMVAGTDWLRVRREHWELAEEAAAAMIDRLLDSGLELVTIAGPFFSEDNREHLLGSLVSRPTARFVMLKVSLEESIRRAQAEPGRGLTSDADFVARIYAGIDWSSVPHNDVEIDTDDKSLDDVAAAVADQVLEG